MSTSTEITRLQTARNTIRDKLIDLGLASSTDKLDALANAVDGIVNNGSISADVKEGETYTIPAGYHNGSGTVSGVSGGGNYALQSKEITPTKSQQTVTPDAGKYGLSDVVVKAIPDAYQNISSVTATAADVLATKTIVTATGETVAGTMANNGTISQTLSESKTSYTVPAGYHDGKGTVKIETESKTATPTEASQKIIPTTGKVLTQVTVNPIPANYGDVSTTTGVAGDVLAGKIVYGKNATTGAAVKITGTMPNNGATGGSIDGLTVTSYTIPAGYTSGGTVSLTDAIETALAVI